MLANMAKTATAMTVVQDQPSTRSRRVRTTWPITPRRVDSSMVTTITGTAPLTAATVTNGAWGGFGTGVDNGANLTTTVRAAIASAGTTITFNPNGSATGAWTNVNGKRLATVQLSYQI